jgi:hypothetical protein
MLIAGDRRQKLSIARNANNHGNRVPETFWLIGLLEETVAMNPAAIIWLS